MRNTKRMFADALEEEMKRTPLSRVRVSDLCIRCGVERRVFYYHFKDKYDLVAWAFDQDYRAAEKAGAVYTEALFDETHRRFWAKRDFYRRAFEDDSQNSIQRYLLEYCIKTNEMLLKRHLGVSTLSPDRSFAARHFSHGNVGCLVEWLKGDINATPEQLSTYMFACMPPVIREAYAGLGNGAE